MCISSSNNWHRSIMHTVMPCFQSFVEMLQGTHSPPKKDTFKASSFTLQYCFNQFLNNVPFALSIKWYAAGF